MQKKLTAVFDSADQADRAIARLRHTIPDYAVEVHGGRYGSAPADAPYTAALYYPHRPLNYPVNDLNAMPYDIGGRVLLTSEIMGLPVYHDSPTEIQLTMEEADAMRARAVLVNEGAQQTKLI